MRTHAGITIKEARRSEGGFTLIELLVSVVIAIVIFTGIMSHFSTVVRQMRDHQIRLETLVQAQAIIQTISAELRMAGNGVPFDQANFAIGELDLSDVTVTYPIVIADTDAANITFRLNESGEVFLLTADFNPASSLTISLTNTAELAANDPIYISNSTVAGDEGLYGVIASVDTGANTITLNAGYSTTTAATFATGSILEEVPNIIYSSAVDGSGISRDSGFGQVLLGADATMELDFIDTDGNVMSLPMSASDLLNSLRAVDVTVIKQGPKLLSDGTTHSVTVTQTIGIRNLNYF